MKHRQKVERRMQRRIIACKLMASKIALHMYETERSFLMLTGERQILNIANHPVDSPLAKVTRTQRIVEATEALTQAHIGISKAAEPAINTIKQLTVKMDRLRASS